MKGNDPRCFVDTNILVYAFDALEGEKYRKAKRLVEELWESKAGCLSIQVLQEFHAVITRSQTRKFGIKESREIVKTFACWQVFSPQPGDVIEAIMLQEKYCLSYWDAMIVHSAIASRCRLLYSEDLSNGRDYGGTRIVNPFL